MHPRILWIQNDLQRRTIACRVRVGSAKEDLRSLIFQNRSTVFSVALDAITKKKPLSLVGWDLSSNEMGGKCRIN